VNILEAKNLLRCYRPGTSDQADPQIAEALALAEHDPELAQWLKDQLALQKALSSKLRGITPPAGLSEQILSEHAAELKHRAAGKRTALIAAAALVVVVAAVVALFWKQPAAPVDVFAIYQSNMSSLALAGYAMDLQTNNADAIQHYLATNNAPARYVLPAALQGVERTGCMVVAWQNTKVSLLCFRTGAKGDKSDLWLFVADAASVNNSPKGDMPVFAEVNSLATAAWTRDGTLYLLAKEGDKSALQKYL
jgi:hypothetical protein